MVGMYDFTLSRSPRKRYRLYTPCTQCRLQSGMVMPPLDSISPATLIGRMPSERGELPRLRYCQASRQSVLVARWTIWCTTLSPTQARCSRVGQSVNASNELRLTVRMPAL